MALHTVLNYYYKGSIYTCARPTFLVKEALITAGWTIIASGDGNTRVATPLTADLVVGEQGSGGAKDCWRTGADRAHSTRGTLVAGDCGNAASWIVFGNAGREMLWAFPNTTAQGQDHSFTWLVTASGHSFDYTVATASTPPGAPTLAAAERAIMGTRATINSSTSGWQGAGVGTDPNSWVTLVAGDSLEESSGLGFFLFNAYEDTGSQYRTWACLPIAAGTEAVNDPDPVVWYYNGSSGFIAQSNTCFMWDYINDVWRAENIANDTTEFFDGTGSIADPEGTPRAPATAISAIITATTPDLWKGFVSLAYAARGSMQRSTGAISQDPVTSRYYVAVTAYTGSSPVFLLRWPSATSLKPYGV